MKRFFCTTCKKIKHVRVLPDDLRDNGDPKHRTGTCRFHSEVNRVTTRDQVNARGKVKSINIKKTSVSTPKKEGKSKKKEGK